MRLMQHKREAWWFYRYLSVFYDKLVNPFFWTERMREEALALDHWDTSLTVVDVGSGTGFTTQGIVQRVPASQVTCVDQSPHQMQHARQKPELLACDFRLGDAENLPLPTDHFDRYVSAGSIEYWPNPQQGICEAYRVIKPGGRALMIGPLEPEQALSRFIANTWMLFPPAEDYFRWFEDAGFEDIKVRYVRPHWVRDDRYGIAISGRKPAPGLSPAAVPQTAAPTEDTAALSLTDAVATAGRVVAGSVAGFGFIPIALVGYARAYLSAGPNDPTPDPLTREQKQVLGGLAAVALGALAWWLLSDDERED